MTVYRIEDASGIGPYQGIRYASDPLRQRMYHAHNKANSKSFRPCPTDDGIDRLNYCYDSIGCISLKSLKDWFRGFYAGLVRMGFYVVEIEVPDEYVKIGGMQVAFDRRRVLQKRDISPRKNKRRLTPTKESSLMIIRACSVQSGLER